MRHVEIGLLFGDVILGGYQPHSREMTEPEMVEKCDGSSQPTEQKETENIAEENTTINTALLIEKRKIFFERPDDSFESFFDLAKESHKSGTVKPVIYGQFWTATCLIRPLHKDLSLSFKEFFRFDVYCLI